MLNTVISPLQRLMIRRSFRVIARQPDFVAEQLYEHLFEIAPASRMLFACDMRQQGRKLMQMLALSVVGLDTPRTLISTIQELGQRHVGYGVTIRDYGAVGEALLYALQMTLGEDWTPDLNVAWLTFYEFIAEAATLPSG